MAAAIVGTGETAGKELDIGDFSQVIVESKKGKIISLGAGPEAIFSALVGSKANIGLILMRMERAAKKIAVVIQ